MDQESIEAGLKRRAAYMIKKKARDPLYRFPDGEPDCDRIAEYVASVLQIEAHENHWIWELAINTAYLND